MFRELLGKLAPSQEKTETNMLWLIWYLSLYVYTCIIYTDTYRFFCFFLSTQWLILYKLFGKPFFSSLK